MVEKGLWQAKGVVERTNWMLREGLMTGMRFRGGGGIGGGKGGVLTSQGRQQSAPWSLPCSTAALGGDFRARELGLAVVPFGRCDASDIVVKFQPGECPRVMDFNTLTI